MFCGECGTENVDDSSFCGECRATLVLSSGGNETGRGVAGVREPLDPTATVPSNQPKPVPNTVQPGAGPLYNASFKHCVRCGNVVTLAALACPYCGQPTHLIASAKNKTAAILLAVFLGPWTWLYTYKRDSTKFWVGLLVPVLWLVLLILAVTAFATSVATCTPSVNATGQIVYSSGCAYGAGVTTGGFGLLSFVYIIAFILYPALWIWSVVDSAVKPDSFYAQYPNG